MDSLPALPAVPLDVVREYLEALDSVRQVSPAHWLQLKGAARQSTIRSRKSRLREAERRLREAACSRVAEDGR